jgi:glycosyltransferase involved in cell wall biosynthesis
MRYVVPEDGVINWRERIWRRGTARWVNPIHECLLFSPESQHMRFEGAEILHASEKRHASRDERNLRILESIPEESRSVSQKFHVFQSLIALDRDAEAIPKAVEFAQLPDVGKNERYEAFFQLARLAPDSDTKKQMLIQALATDPNRREAFGELGLASLPDDPAGALGWTTAMNAIRLREDPPWNLRRAYYGSLGVSLRAMALRANSRPEEADAIETNHFIRSGAKISLLHATRGRPAQAWKTRMEWLRLAENPDAIEHIFAIDADDAASSMLSIARCCLSYPNTGPVGAWNTAAQHAKGEILVQLSDDFAPFQGWDTAVLSAIGDTTRPAVLAVSDGHRTDALLCMAILTRARYKHQGYLFHPEFFSMHSDDWFTECAHRDGVLIDARDRITFEHLHPAFGKGQMDDTYARSNQDYHYQTGAGILARLRAGVKTAAEVDGWFDFRDAYDIIACRLKSGDTCIEVGSWKGKSAIYLAHRLEDLEKDVVVETVDHKWGDRDVGEADYTDDFLDNLRDSKARITAHFGASVEIAPALPDGYSAVFLDAAHDYASVMADLAAWAPKVAPGGTLAGHDIDSPDVQRALADSGIEYQTLGRCWFRKTN